MIKLIKIATVIGILALTLSVASAKTIYIPDDYAKIQWAVDNATAGDTIIVRDGIYTENIKVNNSVTIKSLSDNPSDTIIQANDRSHHVFEVHADNVTISGFTIKNARSTAGLPGGATPPAGVYLRSDNCTISNNIFERNWYGVYLSYGSSNNAIINSQFKNVTGWPIYAYSSSHNIIRNNTFLGGGIQLYYYSSNNEIENNTISFSPIGIYLNNFCNYNKIKNNVIYNSTYEGINIYQSDFNQLRGNTITLSETGVLMEGADNTILANNTIRQNYVGVHLFSGCENNLIYNNFFENDINAHGTGAEWNITKKAGRNIIGGNYLGGNYWSDYLGKDLDGDGIGDTNIPHTCNNRIEGDWLPLVSVTALPPIAAFTYQPSTPLVNEEVTFNASSSYDPDGFIVSYTWDFGDGNVTTTASPIISHVYSAAGTYTVNLTVTDNDGLTNSTSKQISLPIIEENYTLRILITTNPCSVEGEDGFVINLSVIPRKGIIMEEKSYRLYLTSNKQMYSLARPPQDTSPPVITFVDPTPANNSVLNQNYVFINVTSNEPLATALLNWNGVNITMQGHGTNWYFNMTGLSNGVYAFKVYGADQAGNWNTTELRTVTISLPIIEAGYILTLSVISKPCIPSGESGGYILDLAITSRACRILEEDNYRIYLALQALNAPTSKEPLANLPPIAAFTITPSPAIVNQVVTFNASLSYDPDGTIVSYEWDFGDGYITNTTEDTIKHSYSEAGIYEVTLTVTDDNGAKNSTTKMITVVPAKPSVSISTDKYEYTAGDVMLINITITNPGNEWQNVKFLWRLDIPDYNLSFKVINNKSILLPPEFKKTFVISWRLPKLRASFNASWYVALYDGTISEDTADWRYVGKKGGGRDIAIAEYLREIERSGFLAALNQRDERAESI